MEMLSAKEWYLKHRLALSQQVNPCLYSESHYPSIVANANIYPVDNSQEDREISTDTTPSTTNFSNYLKIFVCFVLVAICTSVLVSVSLNLFGYHWQGWFKSLAIDLGIPILAVWKTPVDFKPTIKRSWNPEFLKGVGKALLIKGAMISLIFISFKVVETRASVEEDSSITTAVLTNPTIISLEKDKARWEKLYDDFSENRVTDRRNAAAQISTLTKMINAERKSLTHSKAVEVISESSDTDFYIQSILILLNVIFGHKLWNLVKETDWPDMPERGDSKKQVRS